MIYDTIIIGAGPAGITAAIYAARKGMKLLVISKDVGGQVAKISVVENYTGYQEITGDELSKKFNEHIKEFKFEFKQAEVERIKKTTGIFEIKTALENFKSKTLIIATGAKPKKLNVKGEDEFRNRGVTYCAACDAPLFFGKDVAVIGGGNSALESGLQLANIAGKIYAIVKDREFEGDRILIEKIEKNKKINVFYNSTVEEILGKKFVEFLKLEHNGEEKEIKVQGIFINTGFVPNTGFLGNLVKLNKKGEVEVDSFERTSMSGIFAAGDCASTSYKQIIIAAGSGATASLSAFKYLIWLQE